MKNFVMMLIVGLVVVTAQGAGMHYSLIETNPGTWEVYGEVNGSADTLGISAYALWVYDIVPGTVSYEENTLKTVDGNFDPLGFTNLMVDDYPNYPIGTDETAFNFGDFQNFNNGIPGVGLTPVDEPGAIPGTTPHVQLGVPALLGVLTTPEGLGIEGKPEGVDTWASPDFGLDNFEGASVGVGLFNLSGDGYLSQAEIEYETYSVTPYVAPVMLPVMGDANGDGVVSEADFDSVMNNFGNTGGEGLLGDANGDGAVSAGDYSAIQGNFGSHPVEGGGTVPEPGMMILLVFGGLGILRRKKYRAV